MTGKDILEPATLAGLGVVAVWLYVCHPRLRPRTLTRALIHVAVSFLIRSPTPAERGPAPPGAERQVFAKPRFSDVPAGIAFTDWAR